MTTDQSSHHRWKHCPLYLFGLDIWGSLGFGGEPYEPEAGAALNPTLLGHSLTAPAAASGKGYFCDSARNPAGVIQRESAFVK